MRMAIHTMNQKKGQWLITGAIVIIAMLSGIVLSSNTITPGLYSKEIETYIFDNIANEFDNALDIIIAANSNSSNIEENMTKYFDFVDTHAIARTITIQEYALIGLPVPSGINITVVNFYGVLLKDLNLTINGVSIAPVAIYNKDFKTFNFIDSSSKYSIKYTANVTDAQTYEIVSNNISVDRRVFGILDIKASTEGYIRRELIAS